MTVVPAEEIFKQGTLVSIWTMTKLCLDAKPRSQKSAVSWGHCEITCLFSGVSWGVAGACDPQPRAWQRGQCMAFISDSWGESFQVFTPSLHHEEWRGLFLHENQGQWVWQNDGRSRAFRQKSKGCCSCGEIAAGPGSVGKARVGCGHHSLKTWRPDCYLLLQTAASLLRRPLQLTPSLTCKSPFICSSEPDFYLLKGTLVALLHSSFLAHSPELNCAFLRPVLQVTNRLLTCCCRAASQPTVWSHLCSVLRFGPIWCTYPSAICLTLQKSDPVIVWGQFPSSFKITEFTPCP